MLIETVTISLKLGLINCHIEKVTSKSKRIGECTNFLVTELQGDGSESAETMFLPTIETTFKTDG